MTTSVANYVKKGLSPLRLRGGRPNSGGFNTYPITNGQAENIFKGDLVRVNGGTVSVCPVGGKPTGVFLGCTYATQANGVVESNYFPSGTSMGAPDGRVDGYNQPLAKVLDDPDATYVIGIKTSSGSTSFQGGDYADVSTGGGNTTFGQATGHARTSANVSATVAHLKVIGPVQLPGWDEDADYSPVEVMLNPDNTGTGVV